MDVATSLRLEIAREVSAGLETLPDVRAIIAVGSVALDRCGQDSDLDLVIITEKPKANSQFNSLLLYGVRVDCEWFSVKQALKTVSNEGGDVKVLRDAARLAHCVPIYDPDEMASTLRRLAAALRPDEVEIRRQLELAFSTIICLADNRTFDAERCWDGVQALCDSLAFMTLLMDPRRYQKAKWAVADLCAAGHRAIAELLLRAYFADNPSAPLAHETLVAAKKFVDSVGEQLGLPVYASMPSLDLKVQHSEWGYVCRCLADAESLVLENSWCEAQYVAKFSGRLAIGLLAADDCVPSQRGPGLISLLEEPSNKLLLKMYRSLFYIGFPDHRPGKSILRQCLQATVSCRGRFEEVYVATQ